MITTTNTVLIFAAVTTGLLAGLFYAYSCSVNPGLGALPDAEYLAAMQSINRAIQNGVFLLSFAGAMILLPITTLQHLRQPERFGLLLAATVIYAFGSIGVTFLGNIPLNNALDAFNIKAASVAELAQQRAKFEKPWNNLHTIRTLASILSFLLVVIACIRHGKMAGE